MHDIENRQAVSLSDDFLQELVQELDHEDIVGITLGGSYARGTATLYSDVDLACFWCEEMRPPPKRFLYRQGKLISIKMTSVAEIRVMLKQPHSAVFFANGVHRLLLDKDGSVPRLLAEIEAFRWEDIQEAANEHISLWMMLKAEDVQKILREFQQENALGLVRVIARLVAELTLLTALYYGILITSDSTYYQQVQEAAGLDSDWTHYHCIATGVEDGPSGIGPLRARGIAALHLYRETLVFARPVMKAEHLSIAEEVLRVVEAAVDELPLSEEERRWLKNGSECVFCRIILHQLPAWILTEDEHIIAFLSKNNHPLVVPKKHLATIYEVDELTASQVMQAAVQIARAVKAGLGCEGVYLTQANEAAAGQDVFHFHLHVYPRWSDVNFAQQQAPGEVSAQEKQVTLQKIRSALEKR